MNVITTIKGFGDYLWTDVVAQIDAMGDQVNVFLAQSKKLPKVSHTCVCPVDPGAADTCQAMTCVLSMACCGTCAQWHPQTLLLLYCSDEPVCMR